MFKRTQTDERVREENPPEKRGQKIVNGRMNVRANVCMCVGANYDDE